jgi:hypothetical protein
MEKALGAEHTAGVFRHMATSGTPRNQGLRGCFRQPKSAWHEHSSYVDGALFFTAEIFRISV